MNAIMPFFVYFLCIITVTAYVSKISLKSNAITRLNMADVEIVFPNKKKAKVAAGSALKDAAKKAGFKPNYGCSEGKCGSCELKFNGKKIRPCIAKVPGTSGTLTDE